VVQNLLQTKTIASDPISALVTDRGGPLDIKTLTEDEVSSIIECARPNGGRRRDSVGLQLRRQWWVNALYYCGIQNIEFSEMLADVAPGIIEANGGYVANHILRLVMGNVARLSNAKVDWSVLPNTPDQVDQQGAKVGQQVLDHLHRHLKLGQKRLKACLSLDIFGNAFAYAGWDPSKGQVRKFYYDPMTKQPVAKQQLAPDQLQWLDGLGAFEERNDGDHDSRILTPFDVWLPSRFEELDDMPWILTRRLFSIDEVWNRWPDKAMELPTEGTEPLSTDTFRNRLSSLVRREGLIFGNSDANDGGIDVDEWWLVPSKRVPTGLYIAAAGDTVLEWGPHKYAEAGLDIRFPLVDFHNIRVPGRFWSMSTVEHLIGPQTEYNRARSQTNKHRDILGTPQWLAPIGTLSRGVVRNETGDVLEYNPRIGKPELVAPPPMGDHQIVSGQQAQSDMQMIASFSDASLGNMPQGARSGNVVAMLQERDQLGVGPVVLELEASFERWGTQLLKIEHKFAKIPRAIQVYGESRQADIRYFKGSDLNGNTHVVVKAGSMTPKSRAATIELLSQLMTLGAINPADPAEKRLVLESLEVGGIERLFLLQDGSRRRAKIENLMFSKPDPSPTFSFPDVTMWDDHQEHVDAHREFINTDEYELMNPMIKLMFQAHVQKHVNAVAQQAMAVAAVQAATGGGEGGGGSPQAKPLGKASPPSQNASSKSGPNP
jgi:hypothetical protein